MRCLRRRVVFWVVGQGTRGVDPCSSAGIDAGGKPEPAEDGDNDQGGAVEVRAGLSLLDVKVLMRDADGEEPEPQAVDVGRLSDGSGGSSVEICVELEEGRRELDEGSFCSDPVTVLV